MPSKNDIFNSCDVISEPDVRLSDYLFKVERQIFLWQFGNQLADACSTPQTVITIAKPDIEHHRNLRHAHVVSESSTCKPKIDLHATTKDLIQQPLN